MKNLTYATKKFKNFKAPTDYRLYRVGERKWMWMELTFEVIKQRKHYALVCWETGNSIPLKNKFDHEKIIKDYISSWSRFLTPLRTKGDIVQLDFKPNMVSFLHYRDKTWNNISNYVLRTETMFGCYSLKITNTEKGFWAELLADYGVVYDCFLISVFNQSSIKKWANILRLIQLDLFNKKNGLEFFFEDDKLKRIDRLPIYFENGTNFDYITFLSDLKEYKFTPFKRWSKLNQKVTKSAKLNNRIL